jgi:hypothetical protein
MSNSSLVSSVLAAKEPNKTYSQAEYDAGVSAARSAGHVEGESAGKAEGVKEGATAERKRIAAILDDDKAKGRESLARHFAFETDQSAEQALAALEKAPAEASKETLSPLAKAMSEQRRPDLGPGGERTPRDASHGWDSVVAKANARVRA